jgi:uncharacterized protein YndB with AHSA1/START domain
VVVTPDEVHKELTIDAPRDRVWRALTEPDQLLRWFPTVRADVDLRPDGELRFEWEESADEGVIDVVEPPTRLVFRWRPAGLDRPFTTVSITLDDDGAGTRVVLVERGFASLADQIKQQSWQGNDLGWTEELEAFRAYLEAS